MWEGHSTHVEARRHFAGFGSLLLSWVPGIDWTQADKLCHLYPLSYLAGIGVESWNPSQPLILKGSQAWPRHSSSWVWSQLGVDRTSLPQGSIEKRGIGSRGWERWATGNHWVWSQGWATKKSQDGHVYIVCRASDLEGERSGHIRHYFWVHRFFLGRWIHYHRGDRMRAVRDTKWPWLQPGAYSKANGNCYENNLYPAVVDDCPWWPFARENGSDKGKNESSLGQIRKGKWLLLNYGNSNTGRFCPFRI